MFRKCRTLCEFFIILFNSREGRPFNGNIEIAIQTVSKLNIGQCECASGKVAMPGNLRFGNRQLLVQILQ